MVLVVAGAYTSEILLCQQYGLAGLAEPPSIPNGELCVVNIGSILKEKRLEIPRSWTLNTRRW